MSLEGLRRGALRVMESGKGKGKGGFYLKWKPPKKPMGSQYQVAEPILFMPAQYTDPYNIDPATGQPTIDVAYHFREHNFRRGPKDFRSCICSAGPDPQNPQPCNACREVDLMKSKSGEDRTGAEARDQWVFNIAHLVAYHTNVPLERDGKIIMKRDRPTEPVLIEEQCVGRGCKHCAHQLPMHVGSVRAFQVGAGHLNIVLGWNDKVGCYCANCLTPVGKPQQYFCPRTNELLTDEYLAKFSKTPVQCHNPQCGLVTIPEAVLECGYDPTGQRKIPGTGCPDNVEPKRLSLFDCIFYVQREGEGTDTKIIDVSWQPKGMFQSPDGRSLDQILSTIQPLNFPEMFKPEPLDKQASRLGINNHYATQAPAYSPYPNSPAQPYSAPVAPGAWAPPQGGFTPGPSRPNYGK
jgi:hypothetical protein